MDAELCGLCVVGRREERRVGQSGPTGHDSNGKIGWLWGRGLPRQSTSAGPPESGLHGHSRRIEPVVPPTLFVRKVNRRWPGTMQPARVGYRVLVGRRYNAGDSSLADGDLRTDASETHCIGPLWPTLRTPNGTHARRRRLRHQTAVHEVQFTRCRTAAQRSRRFGMDAELCGLCVVGRREERRVGQSGPTGHDSNGKIGWLWGRGLPRQSTSAGPPESGRHGHSRRIEPVVPPSLLVRKVNHRWPGTMQPARVGYRVLVGRRYNAGDSSLAGGDLRTDASETHCIGPLWPTLRTPNGIAQPSPLG